MSAQNNIHGAFFINAIYSFKKVNNCCLLFSYVQLSSLAVLDSSSVLLQMQTMLLLVTATMWLLS